MADHSKAIKIRAKKLGVLIRDARLAAGKSSGLCAEAIGVSDEIYTAYELGESSPSLPELEMLALFLNVPREHFWSGETYMSAETRPELPSPQQLLPLRQRVIGVMLRKARVDARLSQEELAEKLGIPVEELQQYEFGARSLPVPLLETIAGHLELSVQDFQDRHGPVGAWFTRVRAVRDFQELSPELQEFVSKPINRPYLDLAMRLSEMSVEKLRSIAEGLLEITY